MTKGKYSRALLRDSYREDGKVKHHTIANLSNCSDEEIQALHLALKYKGKLDELLKTGAITEFTQGSSFGAVWVVYQVARQLGIEEALGTTQAGKLAMWQVIARVIGQGSRLSAVRLASSHAAYDILQFETSFDEEHLYRNLDWLESHHSEIEQKLYKQLYPAEKKPELFLYDVTSSYLEGIKNELATFGYNRDKKTGKMQIVIGLLCDQVGRPLAIEVFRGNTQDPATVAPQIKKVAEKFGAKDVTFVGDRGMIKAQQVEDLLDNGFHYITAITKPQIETLLAQKLFDMSLFDQPLAEVQTEDGVRYVLRRNPIRANELKNNRQSKLDRLNKEIERQNKHLTEHSRAGVETAQAKIQTKAKNLKISDWVEIEAVDRKITLSILEEELAQASKLDGCYVIKTDLSANQCSMKVIHDRYKSLAQVEWAFRSSKTVELEMRPVYLRLAERTSAHAFVVMLAYRIIQELADRWKTLNLTVGEGIEELKTLCVIGVQTKEAVVYNKIPEPRPQVKQLLDLAGVQVPEVLPASGIHVATRKQLQKQRKKPS
jgi:transposase